MESRCQTECSKTDNDCAFLYVNSNSITVVLQKQTETSQLDPAIWMLYIAQMDHNNLVPILLASSVLPPINISHRNLHKDYSFFFAKKALITLCF